MKSSDRIARRDLYRYDYSGSTSSKSLHKSQETASIDSLSGTVTVRRPKPSNLIANGTPFSITSYQMVNGSGLSEKTVGSVLTRFEVSALCLMPSSESMPSWPSSLDTGRADLDNRILGQIKASQANAAVDIAEMKQTRQMITGLATDVVKTFHRLRSGRALNDFVRSLAKPRTRADKQLANRWLEYNYGWVPLMSSIHDYSKVAANRIKDGMTQKVVSSKHFETIETGVLPIQRVSGSRKVVCYFRVSDPSLKTVTELGLTNPALVAWELVPFSFVVDWVVDIGGYAERMDALLGTSDVVLYDVLTKQQQVTWKFKAGTVVNGYSPGQAKNSVLKNDVQYYATLKTVTRAAPRTVIHNTFGGFREPSRVLHKMVTAASLAVQLQSQIRRVPK